MIGQLFDVLLDELDDGTNVRTRADAGLKRSILEHGLLQPITVCRRDGRFAVLYGHRRAAGARAAGLASIPAMLVPEPGDLPLRQLAENLDRKAVDPIDVAPALRATLDAHPGMTQGELAKRIGRSSYYVSMKLGLLAMDPETRRRISTGELGEVRAHSARKASTPQGARGRPRILALGSEGRSRSVVIPLAAHGATKRARATVGVDFEEGHVDLVIDDGGGRSVMVSLSPDQARLLGRRLTQACQAIA